MGKHCATSLIVLPAVLAVFAVIFAIGISTICLRAKHRKKQRRRTATEDLAQSMSQQSRDPKASSQHSRMPSLDPTRSRQRDLAFGVNADADDDDDRHHYDRQHDLKSTSPTLLYNAKPAPAMMAAPRVSPATAPTTSELQRKQTTQSTLPRTRAIQPMLDGGGLARLAAVPMTPPKDVPSSASVANVSRPRPPPPAASKVPPRRQEPARTSVAPSTAAAKPEVKPEPRPAAKQTEMIDYVF